MAMNKGGRPAHHKGEVKKAAIAVRTAPSIRNALKAAADEAGRSITQEVEARLAASLEAEGGRRSPETWQLLAKIGLAIAEIEAATNKRWHKDRKTAGAVLEMLKVKADDWIATDPPSEDDVVVGARRSLMSALNLRERMERVLADLGVHPVTPRRTPRNALEAFGRDALSQSALSALDDLKGRWRERIEVDRLDVPQSVKQAALSMIGEIEELDAMVARAETDYTEALTPYVEAELRGRQLFNELEGRKAERLAKGVAD